MTFNRAKKLSPLSLSKTLWSAAFVAFVSRSALASPIMTTDAELPLPTSTDLVVASTSVSASVTPTPAPSQSYLDSNVLAVDSVRPLFVDGHWTMVEDHEWELRKRSAAESSSSSPSSSSSHATTSAASSTTASMSALPSPMDENLDFNFTTNGGKSCPQFLNRLLDADEFKACYPISMLLKGSSSFFTAQKQLQTIVSVLDATCDVNYTSCATYLKQQAANLTSLDNCSEEYANQSSNIMMVYWGLVSYEPLYKATCVRDPQTSMYCYANAVTNTSTTGNAYTYFMPLNSSFPDSAKPTCTTCLQETMAVFQSFTDIKNEPLSYNYKPAAKIINGVCGAGFVNETVLKATQSGVGGVATVSTSAAAAVGARGHMQASLTGVVATAAVMVMGLGLL